MAAGQPARSRIRWIQLPVSDGGDETVSGGRQTRVDDTQRALRPLISGLPRARINVVALAARRRSSEKQKRVASIVFEARSSGRKARARARGYVKVVEASFGGDGGGGDGGGGCSSGRRLMAALHVDYEGDIDGDDAHERDTFTRSSAAHARAPFHVPKMHTR